MKKNYTVILCVDYEEEVLKRYSNLLRSSQIQGKSTRRFGSLYISERHLQVSFTSSISYDLILAFGQDDANDIADRIYNEGGEIAVAFFDLNATEVQVRPLIRSMREYFPSLICAVAVRDEDEATRPQDLFSSPSEWLYYQSRHGMQEMEQLIAHLISSFVLHREKETALVKNEFLCEGLRTILDASPELLQQQNTVQLAREVLKHLCAITSSQNAFVLLVKNNDLVYSGGIGEFATIDGFRKKEYHHQEHFFQNVLANKRVMRLKEGVITPLLVKDRRVGVIFFDNEKNEMRDSELLEVFSHHVAFAIENQMVQQELKKKQALEHELKLASTIQESLLPKKFPESSNMNIYGVTRSAKEIGGDYFDVIEAEKNLYFCIGDVSGKGVAAGLIMSELRSFVRAFVEIYQSSKDILLNSAKLLLRDIAGSGKFVSMLLLCWDGNKLSYSSAGHEHILHYRIATGKCEAYRSGGVVLGVDFKNFSRLVKEKELELEKGDVVVLFTDGATEAHNIKKEMYKLERLREKIEEYHQMDIKGMIEAILADVQSFIGKAEQHDDITLLGMRYLG
ncbi:SpoIIE family protein phosphatase [Candidatus Uabimicrobium amorphum]|uniref:Sigma factor sigB regulation protein rsbU n=1 Tax=Uabimicrobium amorphum TaxID=2596890 RepID=A0A5S9F374_UABAM|nr:SpoIIE family protein phosphatase [Candidatus Uabimicrobium amorphum]BBM83853.1 sigma factor sigB regulation protein rsbU [Candidatus Uabimicrobium amorphum]